MPMRKKIPVFPECAAMHEGRIRDNAIRASPRRNTVRGPRARLADGGRAASQRRFASYRENKRPAEIRQRSQRRRKFRRGVGRCGRLRLGEKLANGTVMGAGVARRMRAAGGFCNRAAMLGVMVARATMVSVVGNRHGAVFTMPTAQNAMQPVAQQAQRCIGREQNRRKQATESTVARAGGHRETPDGAK